MWHTIQCAVQGRGHIKEDIPCQDKTYTYSIENVTVIALADGAGTAILSHYGAERITKFICEYIASDFSNYFNERDGVAFKRKIVNDIEIELKNLSGELGCGIKDLASTLMAVAVHGDEYIMIHIGDGVIGYLKERQLLIATQPENGEFTNTTVFTTSKDAVQTMKILKGHLGLIEGFVLMSDGTETSLYSKKGKFLAPALKRIMQLSQIIEPECLERQLYDSFENVIKQATTDDCSIAIIMKENNNFRGYRKLSLCEKEELLGIRGSGARSKKIKRFDILLEKMQSPCNIAVLGRTIHLKPKYTRKYLNHLLEKDIIVKQYGLYKTAIIMQK